MSARSPLGEVAAVFLRLGTTSFGGPAAHIAMMEDEVVSRRRWLTREQFLDYLGATNLIPGPNSTELAIHIGHARAGWAGLVAAGVSFILPAALIVSVIGYGYDRYGRLPDAVSLLYGVKPVVIAVILVALWGLARTAITSAGLAVLALATIAAAALGVHELAVLGATGAVIAVIGSAGLSKPARRGTGAAAVMAVFAAGPGAAAMTIQAGATAAPFALWPLFLVFAKAGALLFGSGYVLLAFLRADLVERLGWLTEAQLLDAVAIGQITPGPVFTTATFIGYVLGGPVGAAVATVAIFLPAFFFVAISGPLVPRLRRSRVAGAVLDGVNVASLALMVVVSWRLGRAAIVDWWTLVVAVASLVAIVRYRLNPAWLIAAGAALGWMSLSLA